MEVAPEASQTKEPEGHEFGSYCFEELKPADVMEMIAVEEIHLDQKEPSKPESDEHSIPSGEAVGWQSQDNSCIKRSKEGDEHSTPSLKKT